MFLQDGSNRVATRKFVAETGTQRPTRRSPEVLIYLLLEDLIDNNDNRLQTKTLRLMADLKRALAQRGFSAKDISEELRTQDLLADLQAQVAKLHGPRPSSGFQRASPKTFVAVEPTTSNKPSLAGLQRLKTAILEATNARHIPHQLPQNKQPSSSAYNEVGMEDLLGILEEQRQKIQQLELKIPNTSTMRTSTGDADFDELLAHFETEHELLRAENARLQSQLQHQTPISNTDASTVDDSVMDDKLRVLKAELESVKQQNLDMENKLQNSEMRTAELTRRFGFLLDDRGEINQQELEEAMALVRMRKERGMDMTLDALIGSKAPDLRLYEDIKKTNEELLSEADELKRRLKVEVDRFQQSQNKVIDLQNKLATLENVQQNVTKKSGPPVAIVSKRVSFPEAPAQELPLQPTIEIKLELARFDESALMHAMDYLDMRLSTFCTLDFYNFTTQVTPTAVGLLPQYNTDFRFKVTPNETLWKYLRNRAAMVEIYRCTNAATESGGGSDYERLGVARVQLAHLREGSKWESFEVDIHSSSLRNSKAASSATSLGKLCYSIRFASPSAKLDSAMGDLASGPRLQARDPSSNQLILSVASLRNMIMTRPMSKLYVSFSFYTLGDYVSDPVSLPSTVDTTAMILGHEIVRLDAGFDIGVWQSFDLDQYLRFRQLSIILFGDTIAPADSSEEVVVLGVAHVPLEKLARNERISGEFDVMLNKRRVGTISLDAQWKFEYLQYSEARYTVGPGKIQVGDGIASVRTRGDGHRGGESERPAETSVQPVSDDLMASKKVEIPVQSIRVHDPESEDETGQLQQPSSISKSVDDIARQLMESAAAGTFSKPPPPKDDKIEPLVTLSIGDLVWASPQECLNATLLDSGVGLKQFFLSFEFLEFPYEECESQSLSFTQADLGRSLPIQLRREFKFDQLGAGNLLRSFLATSKAIIPFTLVKEPPEEEGDDGECIDFAMGELPLSELVKDDELYPGDRAAAMIHLYPNMKDERVKEKLTGDASIPLGYVMVELTGLKFLRDVVQLLVQNEGVDTDDVDDEEDARSQAERIRPRKSFAQPSMVSTVEEPKLFGKFAFDRSTEVVPLNSDVSHIDTALLNVPSQKDNVGSSLDSLAEYLSQRNK